MPRQVRVRHVGAGGAHTPALGAREAKRLAHEALSNTATARLGGHERLEDVHSRGSSTHSARSARSPAAHALELQEPARAGVHDAPRAHQPPPPLPHELVRELAAHCTGSCRVGHSRIGCRRRGGLRPLAPARRNRLLSPLHRRILVLRCSLIFDLHPRASSPEYVRTRSAICALLTHTRQRATWRTSRRLVLKTRSQRSVRSFAFVHGQSQLSSAHGQS